MEASEPENNALATAGRSALDKNVIETLFVRNRGVFSAFSNRETLVGIDLPVTPKVEPVARIMALA